MMRQMREATKPIMLLAAIAFVGLMVFEWGMDASGQSGGGLGAIGSVNGDPVMYESYMAAYRQIYDQVQRSQEELISTQQNADIEDAAFDEVVNQLLILQELDRRGIAVTNQEISEAAQFQPPDYLRPQFLDEAGNLDLAGYQSFLVSLPPEQLLILEAYYRDVIPRGKLLRQVSSGIFASDAELWQEYRDQSEQVEIQYVPMNPANRYADTDFTVTDAEVEAY
ncbi:MAG: SurA N-terminal domain-containing protein, partial [Longimicrobiales bacterium]